MNDGVEKAVEMGGRMSKNMERPAEAKKRTIRWGGGKATVWWDREVALALPEMAKEIGGGARG